MSKWGLRVFFGLRSGIIIRPTRPQRKKKTVVSPQKRTAARELVHGRLEHFNQFYRFSYNKVFIRNQRTRWGSCSSNGNLNFNYRILMLPPELQDYLIVHELCHLKEFNHGEKFWNLVELQIPNHKQLRKSLHGID